MRDLIAGVVSRCLGVDTTAAVEVASALIREMHLRQEPVVVDDRGGYRYVVGWIPADGAGRQHD